MLSDAEMDDLRWKADLIGGCVPVRPEELRALLDEIARLRAELDRRPDISAEDARAFMMFKPVPARDSREGPVMHALRAHAAKAGKP